MAHDLDWATSADIAKKVSSGQASAISVTEAALARIARLNPVLNAFTAVTAERARARAKAIDASDKSKLPLAGVPFAVKNLFDIEGLATVAGSKINRAHPPAKNDSPLIAQLEAAGAVLVGALNMGEYAYDFTGENVHDGPSRNPHDITRMSGGSSGGSGSAVGGGLVPLALGSDTNGSIRVPSSLCGIFGLKPTYGRLTRARTVSRSSPASIISVRSRARPAISASATTPCRALMPRTRLASIAASSRRLPLLDKGIDGLRIAVAGGYFRKGAAREAHDALDLVAKALGARHDIEIPEAARARAAAYVITTTEGAALHLDRLRKQANDFDPAVRDRLIAGAMVPSTLVVKAQIFRRWYRDRVLELFKSCDAILAPATPVTAPKLGQVNFSLDGVELPVRANMGIYTQPISFIGLPVAAVPVPLKPLPIAVQVICAPWREDIALRIAHALEQMGVCAATKPNL